VTRNRAPRMQGERGAALILAIAFMVVIGGISAAVVSTTTSGIQDRAVLDQARNREYAADAAIENAIARVRGNAGVCSVVNPFPLFNKFKIHVDCTSAPAVVAGPGGTLLVQNDVIFSACVDASGAACGTANTPTIINAQVNFQGTGAAAQVKTFVQSWSVNR
jgi:type II secretory pathway pseudopilin PulG